MKSLSKSLFLAVLFVSAGISAYSQTAPTIPASPDSNTVASLSDANRKAYITQQLNIQVFRQWIGTFYAPGLIGEPRYYRPYIMWGRPIELATQWIPYSGLDPISESEFFKIAGYEAQAEKALAFHAEESKLRTTSLVLGIPGFAALIGGAILASVSDGHGNYPYQTAGLVTAGAGILLTGASGGFAAFGNRGNLYTLDQARAVMDDYNTRLLDSLKDKSQ